MERIDLLDNWQVRSERLFVKDGMQNLVLKKIDGWMDATIPCDVRVPLLANGIITEPTVGDNCYQSEWIEDRSWWFKREFEVCKDMLDAHSAIELICEALDVHADVYINGIKVGHQTSAFYPFEKNVKPYLVVGLNTLLIRLTAGLEYVSNEMRAEFLEGASHEIDANGKRRGDGRRIYIRKPQYCFGWDWAPRAGSCGIMKPVYLKPVKTVEIVHCRLTTKQVSPVAKVHVEMEVVNHKLYSTIDGVAVSVKLISGNQTVDAKLTDILLRSGLNYIEMDIDVEDAKLWWPNGMGEPTLYDVHASITTGNIKYQYPTFRHGIRTITVNMDRTGEDERNFMFTVNGKLIFAKGADWIPADVIYGRVTDEKYYGLIEAAKEANFNMLRIWGGGLYEKDAFYDACDENGIMIWHDFMFACALYPDHEEWFVNEVVKEATYQTRRLSSHACIALWCGNNECHEVIAYSWLNKEANAYPGGIHIYNDILPEIVRRYGADTVYWNSSPYGGEGPHDTNIGDRHHWGDCMMNPVMENRITPEEYDKATSRFISEYGYIGPCPLESIVTYHGEHEVVKYGKIWQLHNNTFEKATVPAGILKHYGDPESMDMEQYILYASMCQSMVYEYSLSSFRSKPFCGGGLFWMYADCWGETGWTIVDYYLRKKPAYFGVKRAFHPIKIILRKGENNWVNATLVNDTNTDIQEEFECGYVSLDGSVRDTKRVMLTFPAHTRSIISLFELTEYDISNGVHFAKPVTNSQIDAVTLRQTEFKKLNIVSKCPEIISVEHVDGKTAITIKSDVFAHGVHISAIGDNTISDNYFDLLPGEAKTVWVQGTANSNDFAVHSIIM